MRSGFDAATSEREFIIAASDYAAALIVGPLRGILREEAPGPSVDFIPTAGSGIQGQMADYSRIDLLVGPTGYQMQGASKQLFRDSFVAVADAGNPLLQQPRLTLEDLTAVPHAVGYFGEGISTPADKLFEARGIQRRVAAVVAGFLSLPLLVEGTDLVALVPRMLAGRAQRGADIAVLEFSERDRSVPGGGHVLASVPGGGPGKRVAAVRGPALLRPAPRTLSRQRASSGYPRGGYPVGSRLVPAAGGVPA